MSRPLRIEYQDAYYHVMNRGAGCKDIYNTKHDYNLFLEVLSEASSRFEIEIFCYCLMSNHYHLLIKTPNANLGRAMRHINGVYTQRYNRAHKTDGPLFRGRYKAILVESDSYLLHLSKYIHLNPLKARLVEDLKEYRWSSYLDYIKEGGSAQEWLNREEVYGQLNSSVAPAESYKLFIQNKEIKNELLNFYGKERLSPILGSDQFIKSLPSTGNHEEVARIDRVEDCLKKEQILSVVSDEFDTSLNSLLKGKKGPGVRNLPRKVAMYFCQHYAGYRLKDIAEIFNLAHYGGVSSAIRSVEKNRQSSPELQAKINNIINRLDP